MIGDGIREGDVLVVSTAGAYGAVMSSDYNLRPRATETLLRSRADRRHP